MNSNRKNTILAGLLIILGMIAGIFSVVPSIDSAEYLVKVAENANEVYLGAVFHFIMSVAYIGVAILLYPLIKEHNKSLALGFLSFRIIATSFLIMGVVSLLLLLNLSQEYVEAAHSDLVFYQTIGDLLRSGRDFTNHIAMIISLNIGGIMFYVLLFKSELIPRWLSAWGLMGATLAIVASLLVMFDLIEIITPVYISLNVPLALQELIMAIWLIVIGFNPNILNSKL